MSMDYWPILGYGLAVEPDLIDFGKAAELLNKHDIEPEDRDVYGFVEVLFKDVVPGLPPGPAHCLIYCSEGEMGDGVYVYLPPHFPWETKGDYARLTPEAVADAIADLLTPYLAEGVGKEDVKRRVGEIFSVGCG